MPTFVNLPTHRPPPSKWKLLVQSYVALLIATLLGVVASTPAIYSRIRCYSEMTYRVSSLPSDDETLVTWARSQPGVISFQAERRNGNLWIRLEYSAALTQRPSTGDVIAKLTELNYRLSGMADGSMGMANGYREVLTDPKTLGAILAGMQVAFSFVGLNRLYAAARQGQPLPPLFPGNHRRAVLVGAFGGLLLLALGLLNSLVLRLSPLQSPPSPWDEAKAMPLATKAVFLVFGTLGAPLAEELFFRGYMFGKFQQAGYVPFGILISSLLFGVVHFSDPYNVPAICLYGIVLATLYHRTGSLLSSIVAHAVNNGIAITSLILGWG